MNEANLYERLCAIENEMFTLEQDIAALKEESKEEGIEPSRFSLIHKAAKAVVREGVDKIEKNKQAAQDVLDIIEEME